MSYRIAICDDNPQDAGFVQNILDRWSGERGAELRVERFPSAESFMFRYEEDKAWDILLLDIEMGEMVRLPFYEIRYLDVRQNYVTIHAKREYTVKRTLGEFEKELDERFCRVGRAMILNLKYVQRVTKTEVHLSDGTVFPLPRGAYEPLNRAIIERT